MAGRIRDGKLHRQVMRPAATVMLVHQRYLNLAVGRATAVGEPKIGLGPNRLAVEIAKAQRVDQCRAMFQFAIRARQCRFAIGLNRITRPGQGNQTICQQFAQNWCHAGNVRHQIFDIPTAMPWIFNNGGHPNQSQHWRGWPCPIAMNFLIICHDFA